MAETVDFYAFKTKDINGSEYDFNQLRGKVVLVVNTASKCGFTPQFEGLEKLYQTYKDQGLVVLGFPCNQFAGQDPAPDADIHSFCSRTYNVTFPMMAKIDVNGDKEAPVYNFLKSKKKGFGLKRIKWNFTKFLVDRKGEVVERYAPLTKPQDIVSKIEALLKE